MCGGRIVGVFEQFGISVYRSQRGRGGFIYETDRGLRLIRETNYGEEKFAKEDYITKKLVEAGLTTTDTFERTLEGNILTEYEERKRYYMKKWIEASECDVKNYGDVLNATRAIGKMHNYLGKLDLENLPENIHIPVNINLEVRYKKKLKEMKTITNYLRKKKNKTEFERMAYENMGTFVKEAIATINRMEDMEYNRLYDAMIERKELLHGSCNHHNILVQKGVAAVVNYERVAVGHSITDLYDFMRKILEKYNWDIKLAYRMIDEYNKERNIDEASAKILSALFTYPEKYFKVMNHYYNSSKAWLPDKDKDKLFTVVKQNEARLRFVESLK